LLEEGGQEDKKAGQRWDEAMKHLFVLIFSFFLIKQKGKVETAKYNFGHKSILNI